MDTKVLPERRCKYIKTKRNQNMNTYFQIGQKVYFHLLENTIMSGSLENTKNNWRVKKGYIKYISEDRICYQVEDVEHPYKIYDLLKNNLHKIFI